MGNEEREGRKAIKKKKKKPFKIMAFINLGGLLNRGEKGSQPAGDKRKWLSVLESFKRGLFMGRNPESSLGGEKGR